MKILYVENHAAFAQTACQQFLAQHEVQVVPTIRQAVALLDDRFDAYLVDFDLDDGKGDAFIRAARLRGSREPVIGVSSHEDGNAALVSAGASMALLKKDFASVASILNGIETEGLTSTGTIKVSVSRDRIPKLFRPVVGAVVSEVASIDAEVSLYLYCSVATGMAQEAQSDVDVLTVGMAPTEGARIGEELSQRFSGICGGVEFACAQRCDFVGESDEAYGGCVFLRHYCVHLAGPDLHSGLPDFPADARAARGFNGDIAQHARRWARELEEGASPALLGRRIARKSLLAVGGLVSVHDETWTTHRARSAARWAAIRPALDDELRRLVDWAAGGAQPDRSEVQAVLSGAVAQIVSSFETTIGLWKDGKAGQ